MVSLVHAVPAVKLSDEARRSGSGGTSVFQVLVDEDRLPRAIGLIAPAGKGLDRNALAAVRDYQFKLATLDGISVPYFMTLEVDFRM